MFPLPSACFSNGWCALLIRWLKSLSLKYLNFWRFVSVGFYSCPLIRTTGPEVSQWILSVPDIVFLTPLCNSNLVPPGNWDQSPCWVQWTLFYLMVQQPMELIMAKGSFSLQFTGTMSASHLEVFFLWTLRSLVHAADVLPVGYWLYL